MGWAEAQFESIQVWPGTLTKRRERSRFQSSWSSTVDLLDRELVAIKAKVLVCEMAITYADIGKRGQVLASARPEHPGIVLSFESMHGPLRYACDRFDDWHDNVRAIALGLEALRKLDRYGITQRGEQYTGWRALPSGLAMPAGRMTVDQAIATLHEFAPDGWDYDDPTAVQKAYRRAAVKLHPDVGGDPELFKRLTEARDVLVTL